MNPNTEKLRQKYMDNPPKGMTSEDIRRMSEDDLLDMDYFLNVDDLLDDEAGVFISSKLCRLIVTPRQACVKHMFDERLFFFHLSKIELSYKIKIGAARSSSFNLMIMLSKR